MAQDNQLEFPPRQPAKTGVRPDEVPDLTRREDKQELFALIAAHTKALEDLFDEGKYTVEQQSFLHKKTHLYQWKKPELMARLAEKRAPLLVRQKAIEKKLRGELGAKQRQELEEEQRALLVELEEFTLRLDMEKAEKLAEAKKNRLRTNWVTSVLATVDNIEDDFSEKRLGADYGFSAIAGELGSLQAQFKEFLRQEERIKSELEDFSDADDPRVKLRLEVMAAELRDIHQMKKEFVTVTLEQFKDRCLQRLRDLRRRLLGEKLEV